MSLNVPDSMEECLYFTNRSIGENGQVMAWVYRKECPKCKGAKMGKPVDPKTGRAKTRAKEYTCPECGKDGEGTCVYRRKKYKGVDSYLIECEHCGEKIPVTKKLKEIKKK